MIAIDIFTALLYIIFTVASLLLILVILLQEGSGGGLAGAFGGAGSEAFGVKAGGINKFTAITAAIFLISAISLSTLRGCSDSIVTEIPGPEQETESTMEPPTEEDETEGGDDDADSTEGSGEESSGE